MPWACSPSTSRAACSAAASIRRTRGLRRVVRLQRAGGARRGFAQVPRRSERLAAGRLDLLRASARPGRSSTGRPRVQSTMADSMPTSQAPPSSTSSASPNSAATWAARGGADAAEAVGAGRGQPQHRRVGLATGCSSACATGCDGQRRPMVSCPPAAACATPARRGTISVSGPGQKASIRRWAKAGTSAAKRPTAAPSAHMHDQRVVARPALGGEDAGHGGIVVGSRAQAVHRLGRKGHQLAGLQGGHGLLQRGGHRAGRGSWAQNGSMPSSAAARSAVARAPRRVGAGHRQVAHLAAGPRARPCRTGAGARRAAPAPAPTAARCGAAPCANHRSPSRLSIIAGLCWRGATSGRPASVRTCSSNCETSQASML